ncbi:MAG: adenylosuccinate lyase [Candidatus Diapherotrites archaeon]|nr:adenylosuccinate lyase [Candidatus Diapherotrites archaeon]
MSVHPIDYRYGSEEMRRVFDEETRLKRMLDVEVALVEALADMGKAPKTAAKEIRVKAKNVKLERVKEIERKTKHDVMAMVKALSEQCSPKTARYVHLTATSYDIVDTALALQLKEGLTILLEKGRVLMRVLMDLSLKYENTAMVGRTHGQHATPITFGFKLANYVDKVGYDLHNLLSDYFSLRGKFSGATGTYAAQKLFGVAGIERKIMKRLDLDAAEISTQVVPREDIAMLVSDMAIMAGTLEQIAKEIRNLQRTEIAEVSEGFGKEQVGSSAMPQKRNPINCENVCSNARVVRSCVLPALENIALEHERDLTNSAAERSVFPTVFLLLDDMTDRMIRVLNNLQVFPEKMKENLDLTKGRIMAEAVTTLLAAKGLERQEAHELLRKASMKSLKEDIPLKDVLAKDKTVMKYLSRKELDKIMKPENYIGLARKKTREVVRKWEKCL